MWMSVTLLPLAFAYRPTSASARVDCSEKSMHARICFAATSETYHLSRMHGMRTLRTALGFVAFWFVVVLVAAGGCSKSANTEGTIAATAGSEATEPRSSRPSRSEIACRLHSCAPPYYCNEDRGICELLSCIESRDCPYGYKCDLSKNVCR